MIWTFTFDRMDAVPSRGNVCHHPEPSEHVSGFRFRSNKDTKNSAEFGVTACRAGWSGTLQA
ncbi:MAG: hypothetical protein EA363_11710 [Balneolaceae bacterium]|nr:MAG: hypothetical protein EA363_11710 [Balneolaceae bacterium]